MPTTSEIVYDQAVRAISQQFDQLDELRARSATILAASGIVTGFLGDTAVKGGVDGWSGLAIFAFVVSAGCCVWILLPRFQAWEFSIDAKALMPYYLDEAAPEEPDALFKYLAEQIQDDFEHNGNALEPLYKFFVGACVALAAEVGCWLLALGAT
jgi:hypothetical protein